MIKGLRVRDDACYSHVWVTDQDDLRWKTIYRDRRWSIAVAENFSLPAQELPVEVEVDALMWCVENCTGRFGTMVNYAYGVDLGQNPTLFRFENETDAVMFRLSFDTKEPKRK